MFVKKLKQLCVYVLVVVVFVVKKRKSDENVPAQLNSDHRKDHQLSFKFPLCTPLYMKNKKKVNITQQ